MNIGTVEGVLRLHDEFTKVLVGASKQLTSLSAQMNRTGAQMGGALAPVSRQSRVLAGDLAKLRGQGAALLGTFTGLRSQALGLVAAYTALRVVRTAVSDAKEYNRTLTQTHNLTGLNREQVQAWDGDLRRLAVVGGKAPVEVAQGLYTVASAGMVGAEAMEVLESSTKASAIGLGRVDDIAKAVTAAVMAYGKENLSAARATDILLATVDVGAADADELAQVIGRVVGIASQMGVSFDEVGASIAVFTRLGVDADEAVTGLRGTLTALLQEQPQQQEALKKVGMTLGQLRAEVREKGLAQAMIDLIAKFRGNEEALIDVIPNVRALASVLGTAGSQSKAYALAQQEIANALGEVERRFKIAAAEPSLRLEQALAKIKVAGLEMGSALLPVLADVATELTNALTAETARDFGKGLAEVARLVASALVPAVKLVAGAIKFAAEHTTELKALLAAIVAMKLATMFQGWVNALGMVNPEAQVLLSTLRFLQSPIAGTSSAFASLGERIAAAETKAAMFGATLRMALGTAIIGGLLYLNERVKEYIETQQRAIEETVHSGEEIARVFNVARNNWELLNQEMAESAVNAADQRVGELTRELENIAEQIRQKSALADKFSETRSDGRVIRRGIGEVAARDAAALRELYRERQQDLHVAKQQLDVGIKLYNNLAEQDRIIRQVADETGDLTSGYKGAADQGEEFAKRIAEVTQRLNDQAAIAKQSFLSALGGSRARVSGAHGQLEALRAYQDATQELRIQEEINRRIAGLETAKNKLTAEQRKEIELAVMNEIRFADAAERVNEEAKLGVKIWRDQVEQIEAAVRAATDIAEAVQDEFIEVIDALDQSESFLGAIAAGGLKAARAAQLEAHYRKLGVENARELAQYMAQIEERQTQVNYLIEQLSSRMKPIWQTYVDGALKAMDAVVDVVGSAFEQFLSSGKVDWDALWQDMKASAIQIFVDMLKEMFKRWLAQQAAMAATDYVAKSGSGSLSKGGGVDAGGVAGAVSTGSGAGLSASTMAGIGVAAFALYVVYKGFIEDHKKKFAEVSIVNGQSMGVTAAHGKKHMEGAQNAAAAILKGLAEFVDQLDLDITRFADVIIGKIGEGFYVKYGQSSQLYKTMEEATSAAIAIMIRFGEFGDSMSAFVKSAIEGTREMDAAILASNIEFARTIETQNLEDIALELKGAIDLAVEQWERAKDVFKDMLGRANLPVLAGAFDSILTRLGNSLVDVYNRLMGIQEDPIKLWQRQRDAYNQQRKLALIQLQLWKAEIQARIAAYKAQQEFIGGGGGSGRPGGGDGGGGGGGTGRGIIGFAKATMYAAGMVNAATETIVEGVDAGLQALLDIERMIDDVIAGLPPEVTGDAPPKDKPSKGGGGGRRQGVRDFINDTAWELALAVMGEYERSVAEVTKKYDEQLVLAGKDEKLRARLNQLKAEELALLERERAKTVVDSFRGFLGLTNQFDDVRDTAADLIKQIEDSPFGDERKTRMIGRVIDELNKKLQDLANRAAASLLGELAQDLEKFGADEALRTEVRRNLAILEHNLKLAHYKAEFAILQAQGLLAPAVIDAMRKAIAFLDGVDPTVVGGSGGGPTPPPQAGAFPGQERWIDGIKWRWNGTSWEQVGTYGGGGNRGGGGTQPDPNRDRDRALEMLRDYQQSALPDITQTLNKINADFTFIAQHLGNTAEVVAAKGQALARAMNEWAQPLRDFRDNMSFAAESSRTVEQQFFEAQAKFRLAADALKGGDLSQRDKLIEMAGLYRQLADQYTEGSGFRFIESEIKGVFDAILAAVPGVDLTSGHVTLGMASNPMTVESPAVVSTIQAGNNLMLDEMRKQTSKLAEISEHTSELKVLVPYSGIATRIA